MKVVILWQEKKSSERVSCIGKYKIVFGGIKMSKKITFKMRRLLSFMVAIVMVFSMFSILVSTAEAAAPESLVKSLDAATVKPNVTGELTPAAITFNVTPVAANANATILVQDDSGTEYVAEQGGRIFKLAAGEYMYTVRAQNYITEMGTLTVDGDATKTVALEVTPPSSLRLNGIGQDHYNGPNTGGAGGTKRDMEVEGSGYVGWIRPPAWIKYANVNLLGGIQQYDVNYAIDGTGTVNLGFDLRLANSGSTFDQAISVGSLALTQRTGGWGSPGRTATQTSISPYMGGVCDVYIVFTQGEYNFGYLNLTLKPETDGVKEYDISFKVKPYDAKVVVEDIKSVTCEPVATGGKSYRLEEGFYRYTVSKPGYETKTVLLAANLSRVIQVVLLPVGADTYKRYEAENGIITGGVVDSGAQYSEGKAVTNFNTSATFGSINSTFSNISNVKFTVEGTTTGIAEVIVGYESSVTDGNQDRIAVKSNDGTTKEVYLNASGKSSVFVDLRAGTNIIYVSNTLNPRVSNSGNAWVNLDYIDVNKTLTAGSVEPGELDEPYIQPKNPIIKSIFTADPEAHVWPTNPNKLYLYPSHDVDPPQGCDLMDVYHIYSTENMVDWVDEGEALRADDLDWNRTEGGFMWAPDAAYKDGYYYFYWPTPTGSGSEWGNTWQTGVVRSKYPDRGFEQINADGFKGYIEGAGGNGMIDVCVRVDADGQAYIYIGGSQKFFQGKLKDDMITLDGPLVQVDTSVVPNYHEGPSVFKRNGLYYFIYPGGSDSSVAPGDKFNYCTSSNPLGPWTYRGSFFNPTGCGTSHGSVVQFKDKWYMFYHTQDLSGNGTLRSVSVDEVIFNEDGTIKLFSKTANSVAQNGPDYVRPDGDVYNASVADVGGGATKSMDASASNGGAIITDLNLSGSYAQFNNVDGGAGGRANIVIHYATPDKLPKLKLIVNGFNYSFINLPSTGGRSFFTGEASFTVKQLEPGATNTIRLEGGNSKANVDYIEVIPFDDSTPPPGLHTITVTSSGIGTASTDKPSAAIGEKVTLTADAANGCTFKEWQIITPIGLTIASNDTFAMPNEDVMIQAVFEVDQTSPVTAATTDGIQENGWYSSDVTVTLVAEDNLAGVDRTEYKIGGSEEWLTYTGPVSISSEGTNTIYYRSTDKAGNVEEAKEQTVLIDKTPPAFTLKVEGNILEEGASFEDFQTLTFNVEDNLSGVNSAEIVIDGVVYKIDPQQMSSIDIDLAGKTGSYTAIVVTDDKAGNRIEKNFTFNVMASISSMRYLIDRFVKSGELDGPLVAQLTNNLDQAQHKIDKGRPDQAAVHMGDFTKHLNNEALYSHVAENAKSVLNSDAEALIRAWSKVEQ